ncbi:hypothetical protein G6F37_004648 [Rhizopus arrhizus]|nr:hypothetical protein G6F37_004648 [Rhizopus arrhizus]
MFKPLRLTHKSVWPRLEKLRQTENKPSQPAVVDIPEIDAAFDHLMKLVVRDFIQSWFQKIAAQEQSFPISVDRVIRSAVVQVTQRLQQIDLLHVLLNRIVPKLASHISDFRSAEIALRGKYLERSVTQSDELDLLLASQFRQGKLHAALTTGAVTTKPTEIAYLRQLLDRVLPLVIEKKEIQSGPVHVVIREILSCSVLQPIMDMLADPDFWNQTIDTYLGKAIIEQEMVQRLREVLNRHSSNDLGAQEEEEVMSFLDTNNKKMGLTSQLSSEFLGVVSEEEGAIKDKNKRKLGRRTFQEFLKIIQEEKNLLDLKRLRNDIDTELRKKKTQIAERDPEEIMDGERVQDIILYISRLEVAKKRVDKRISTLSGEAFNFSMSSHSNHGYSLHDILTNTSGLSYFMEFMDRRRDMVKLQFWLMVESFKNTIDDQKTFLEDVKMVYETYFKDTAPHKVQISHQLVTDLKGAIELAEPEEASFNDNINELRLKLYRIQQHVFWQIEKEHFPHFKRSDLYFKFLSSSTTKEDVISPSRRSLDDRTFYNRTIEEEDHNEKAESDSELSTKNIKASDIVSNSDPRSSSFDYNRTRGHQRALSDSTRSTPNSSKFLSLSSMFGSNLWSTAKLSSTTVNDDSAPAPVQSMEAREYEGEDEEEPFGTVNPRRNSKLIRSNTLDALQAELRSIVDGNNLEEIPTTNRIEDGDDEEKESTEQQQKRSPLAPSMPSSASSVLLLRNSQGIKSSTALPVQQIYTLPSWTSSGGTNSISQIEHDKLDPLDKPPSGSSSTYEPKESESVSNVHFAPPGDLMLETKVEQLSKEIDKLVAQEDIVDALIEKAEIQNRLEELRILKKSKSIFRQELQQMKYQKSQYELQESENTLVPNRSQVNITNATIGSDGHGDFALYVIEIQQLGYDGNYVSGWIVARRYSEFFALHQKLKGSYPAVKLIEFPAKWPLLKLQKPFLEARRISLERYLKRLLDDEEICKSQELRAFLSQQNIFVPGPADHFNAASTSSPSVQNLQRSMVAIEEQTKYALQKKSGFISQIYKTVAANIDDILIAPSILDMITQRLSEQVTEFSQEDAHSTKTVSSTPSSIMSMSSNSKMVDSALHASTTSLPDSIKTEGITRFTEPLCDLFIEMFELKDKTNWLRRQAIVILIQQILEGTIERKLKETVNYLSSSSMIVFYVNKVTDSLWPDGETLKFKEPRRPEEKLQTKEEANRNLSRWLPDLLGNMVGRQNARKGARRLFTVLQNKRLNQDLVYVLLDEFIYALFPELEETNKKKNGIV